MTPAPPPAARATDPNTIILRTRPPDRRIIVELSTAAYGAFALDRASATAADAPGGELALGFRRRRFGADVRAAVDGEWSASAPSSAGPIDVTVRRVVVAVAAHADLALRLGALRLAVGPTLPFYLVRVAGVPHPRSSVVASAAVTARFLYHLDLGRIFVTAGVACDIGMVREELSVTGVGVVARAPLVTLGPLLALGLNL
jgi:hypothetical protein